ncbi:MAG: aspartate kinase, monofunctional class [Methanomicrobiales archaeon HGW-Methanomicrobiales-3]|jgi:aspartate kinase|nr:MAG: aspartate kinase, monofunctional class [Methanomicrobiales archaeon HGW-Methanomicrobiales-3]
MRLLMKFGGTSVADAQCIKRIVDILEEHHKRGDELAVVVSAQRGVTDQLIEVASSLATAKDSSAIAPLIQSLSKRHMVTLEGAAPDYVQEVGSELDEKLINLQNILLAIYNLRELTPRSKDHIVSYGERLLAPILGAALRQRGLASSVLDGCEAGILTTPQHGESTALPESDERIQKKIGVLLKKEIPVIMGFMGCTREGVLTTLGRSGSDYSASIIGAGIDADEIWIWTDVDGIMTCDPRIINDARVMPSLSYLEVMELSYFGAKVMHPRSIEPAMRKNILVRVKNTFNPSHPGTMIIRNGQRHNRVVKALTYIDKVAAININGAQMIGRPGVAKAIFTILADHEVNVMMISQGSSEANISLIVDEPHLTPAVTALSTLMKQGIVREVSHNHDVCAVAVVGAGMAGAPGTGGRIFTALGKAGVNVMMISQGSSEANISFVVSQDDGPRACRVLHDEFRLSEEDDE